MALKASDIRVEAYVHVGDELVNVDALSPRRKEDLATSLTLAYLNALYKGRAEFFVANNPEEGPQKTRVS